MKRVVIALGGNALVQKNEKPGIRNQLKNLKKALKEIAKLAGKNCKIALTHGNGPQVGNAMIRVKEAKGKAYSLPLHVADAQTQGETGYLIEQTLRNLFEKRKTKREVAAVLTQILVDEKDKRMKRPTKPIGPFYTKQEMLKFKKENLGSQFFKIKNLYRLVVPSPLPLEIIEKGTIKALFDNGAVVVCCGGGGIPVTRSKGKLAGVDAVIDKDFASALLAKRVQADTLIILTDVKGAAINFGKKNEKFLKKISMKGAEAYLKKGEFSEGSMKPKIEAAIDFLKSGGDRAIIAKIGSLESALKGKEGTVIAK